MKVANGGGLDWIGCSLGQLCCQGVCKLVVLPARKWPIGVGWLVLESGKSGGYVSHQKTGTFGG